MHTFDSPKQYSSSHLPGYSVWSGIEIHTCAAGYQIQPGQRFQRRRYWIAQERYTSANSPGFIAHVNVAVRNESSLSSNVSSLHKGGRHYWQRGVTEQSASVRAEEIGLLGQRKWITKHRVPKLPWHYRFALARGQIFQLFWW